MLNQVHMLLLSGTPCLWNFGFSYSCFFFFFCQAFQSHELSIPTVLSTVYLNQLGLEQSNSQGNEPGKLFFPPWKEFKWANTLIQNGNYMPSKWRKNTPRMALWISPQTRMRACWPLLGLESEDSHILWAISVLHFIAGQSVGDLKNVQHVALR